MSSYISPAPQGDPKATGAYAVAIAAQAGGTNNDGNATDSAGNVKVDFVWGNYPMQPNDERTENQLSNFGGSTGDTAWAATTYATATRLNLGDIAAKSGSNVIADKNIRSIHEIVETDYAGYPTFSYGNQAVYIITQASGDGTTQTYTAPNNTLKAGDSVNITGTGLDGNGLTVATANRYTFTVAGASTGTYINISGKVRYASELTSNDGSYVAGVPYISVPNVLGQTTALAQDALKDAGYVNGNITTASAATNSPITVTAAARASGSNLAVLTATGAGAAYAVGTKVTIASVDASVNGTYTVVDNATNTFTIATKIGRAHV